VRGSKRRWVVPSRHGVVKVTITVPSGRNVRRSWANGRPQQVATQLLEPPALLARHRDARVQVVAVAACLQRA
jgi:hypothetical protein